MSNSLDRLSWIRVFWEWMKNPDVRWQEPQQVLKSALRASAVTDCKSVYDICTKTAVPTCEEYRTTLECLLIRERLSENTQMRWVNSQAQLADCLTKVMDATTLRESLQSGKYTLFDETKLLQQRADKKAKLAWLKKSAETDVS